MHGQKSAPAKGDVSPFRIWNIGPVMQALDVCMHAASTSAEGDGRSVEQAEMHIDKGKTIWFALAAGAHSGKRRPRWLGRIMAHFSRVSTCCSCCRRLIL